MNIIADNCESLNIESFLNTCGQVKTSKQLEYLNRPITEFNQLKYGWLNFILFDHDQKNYYVWNDVDTENFLKNHFLKLFRNVKEIRLKCFQGSMKILLKSLRYVNIKKLIFSI